MPSPTHHQLASWSGVFGWFCGRRTVFSSICFSGLSQFILLEGNRHVPNMSGLWPYLRIWSREAQDMQRCSVPCIHPSGTPRAWKHPPGGFPHTGASYSSLSSATAVQCQMGINRPRDPKSCAQWFSPTAIGAHRSGSSRAATLRAFSVQT